MMTSCNGRLSEMSILCCWTGEKTRETTRRLSRTSSDCGLGRQPVLHHCRCSWTNTRISSIHLTLFPILQSLVHQHRVSAGRLPTAQSQLGGLNDYLVLIISWCRLWVYMFLESLYCRLVVLIIFLPDVDHKITWSGTYMHVYATRLPVNYYHSVILLYSKPVCGIILHQ